MLSGRRRERPGAPPARFIAGAAALALCGVFASGAQGSDLCPFPYYAASAVECVKAEQRRLTFADGKSYKVAFYKNACPYEIRFGGCIRPAPFEPGDSRERYYCGSPAGPVEGHITIAQPGQEWPAPFTSTEGGRRVEYYLRYWAWTCE